MLHQSMARSKLIKNNEYRKKQSTKIYDPPLITSLSDYKMFEPKQKM